MRKTSAGFHRKNGTGTELEGCIVNFQVDRQGGACQLERSLMHKEGRVMQLSAEHPGNSPLVMCAVLSSVE